MPGEPKLQIIAESESAPRPKQSDLVSKYGVAKSTLSDILKKAEVYKKQNEQCPNRMRFDCVRNYEKLNYMMWTWFQTARSKNLAYAAIYIFYIVQTGYSKFWQGNVIYSLVNNPTSL